MTVLRLQIEALARLAPQLATLGALVKTSAGAAPVAQAADAESPSAAAAGLVRAESIAGLQSAIADRFALVGEKAHQVAMAFAVVEGMMTEDTVAAVMTGSGSLLPPAPGSVVTV